MRILIIIGMFLSSQCMAASQYFELAADVEPKEQYQYLPVTIKYTLTNKGKKYTGPIGINRIHEYVVIKVRYGKEPYRIWSDTTRPHYRGVVEKPRTLNHGESVSSSVVIPWQPHKPVFEKPGIWSIKVVWRGAGYEIESAPVYLNIKQPKGADRKLLEMLRANNALPSLNPRLWKDGDYKSSLPMWKKLHAKIERDFPASPYLKQFSKGMVKIESNSKDKSQDGE